MFTGIVEVTAKVVDFIKSDTSVYQIEIERPASFDDIKPGDSICVNGVCLTVVSFNENYIYFDLGPETLAVTGWNVQNFKGTIVNLERSMKASDRIHGHFLSGHVDELATVLESKPDGEAWLLKVKLSNKASAPMIWKKGSIGISGVSLTVNNFENAEVSVCLVPETVKRTNLNKFSSGDLINIEYDWMAKAFYHQIPYLPERGKLT